MALKVLITTLLTITCFNSFQTANAQIDPRGPISYPGIAAKATPIGVQAAGFQYWLPLSVQSPSSSEWITGNNADLSPATLFRTEFSLSQTPTSVTANITADRKYRLYINGRLVSRGPVDIGTDYAGGSTHRWFYDVRDLKQYFHAGKNAIAAEVFKDWPIGFTITRGHTALLIDATIKFPGGKQQKIFTSADWKCIPAPQFLNANTYDASKEPTSWRMPGFDDTAWGACKVAQDVWEKLVPSEIPPLMEAPYPVELIQKLSSRTITADTTFKVEFNRVLSAYPTLHVRGGKGAHIAIRATQSANMILGDGDQYFEFPFLAEIAPAFSVEITHVSSPVEIVDVGANFTSQPVAYRGSFECSDSELNRLWDVSRWAVQICMQTHHLDSPNHQEPISDPGDYVIEAMVSNYAFGQPWLARQDIRKFAWLLQDEKYSNFHTSYSIAWLQMLLDYYNYTGEKSLLVEMAPYVHQLMATYAGWKGKNGIISEAPNYMFMDWVVIGGFECHHPPAVIGQGYLTAFYYHGMGMASTIAAILGDKARVTQYSAQRAQIREAFNRELWKPDAGLYRDGKPFQTSVKPGQWLPADKDIETFSPHVNLLAVLFDLAPKAKQVDIITKVMAKEPLNTQPWFMDHVFQAIDHAGLFEKYAVPQMKRWKVVPETQSFHEMWNGGDLSHGWCSTPLIQLSSRVLGVTPQSAGYDRISIRPEVCGLKWAKGSVPTRHGSVTVKWNMDFGNFTMDFAVPTGCTAEVDLPAYLYLKPVVTIDGKSNSPTFKVGPGKHHLVLRNQN